MTPDKAQQQCTRGIPHTQLLSAYRAQITTMARHQQGRGRTGNLKKLCPDCEVYYVALYRHKGNDYENNRRWTKVGIYCPSCCRVIFNNKAVLP
jgi:hypothetical protein